MTDSQRGYSLMTILTSFTDNTAVIDVISDVTPTIADEYDCSEFLDLLDRHSDGGILRAGHEIRVDGVYAFGELIEPINKRIPARWLPGTGEHLIHHVSVDVVADCHPGEKSES
jgi:hypothetical protein